MKISILLVSLISIIVCCKNVERSLNEDVETTRRAVSTDDYWIKIADYNGQEITKVFVELAVTPAERAKGLMFRKSLAEDHGMLFIFEEEYDHAFYMKNTIIPLDMIFINSDQKIVGIIENTRPLKEDNLSVNELSKYVLEVSAFFARKNGIKKGYKVIFDPRIKIP